MESVSLLGANSLAWYIDILRHTVRNTIRGHKVPELITSVNGYRGIRVAGSSVYDILVSEMATRFRDGVVSVANTDCLLVESLLSHICYVEYSKGERVQKYLVSRNTSLLRSLTGKSVDAVNLSKLVLGERELHEGVMTAQSVSMTKKGFSLGKSVYSFPVQGVVCIPLFILGTVYEALSDLLSTGAYTLSYYKDNGTLRQLATTLDSNIWSSLYAGHDMICEWNSSRGYMVVPMLGGSVNESKLARSVNLARLQSITALHDLDISMLDMDIGRIKNVFTACLVQCYTKTADIAALKAVDAIAVQLGLDCAARRSNWKTDMLQRIEVLLENSTFNVYYLYNMFRGIPYFREMWEIFDNPPNIIAL